MEKGPLIYEESATMDYEIFIQNILYDFMIKNNIYINISQITTYKSHKYIKCINSLKFKNIFINVEHTMVTDGKDKIEKIDENNKNKYIGKIRAFCRETSNYDIIIDYSMTNIVNMVNANLQDNLGMYKKLLYIPPLLYTYNPISENRDIDCLITMRLLFGRRKKLYEDLIENNINATHINNCFEKDELQKLLKRTKILINTHQVTYCSTAEELRLLPSLLNGVVIISEEAPLQEYIPYHDYIIWTTIEKIPETYKYVKKNYEKIYNDFFGQESNLKNIISNMQEKMNSDINEMIR